jgi:hypothetical protein
MSGFVASRVLYRARLHLRRQGGSRTTITLVLICEFTADRVSRSHLSSCPASWQAALCIALLLIFGFSVGSRITITLVSCSILWRVAYHAVGRVSRSRLSSCSSSRKSALCIALVFIFEFAAGRVSRYARSHVRLVCGESRPVL